jgi:hypothetical protein
VSTPRRVIAMWEELPEEKQQEFLNWLQSLGCGWARWFVSGWLIAPALGNPTVQEMVAKLQEMKPGIQCLIFELQGPPVTWQGFIAQGSVEGAKKWLREAWGLTTY